jgi:hypothetical protein
MGFVVKVGKDLILRGEDYDFFWPSKLSKKRATLTQ